MRWRISQRKAWNSVETRPTVFILLALSSLQGFGCVPPCSSPVHLLSLAAAWSLSECGQIPQGPPRLPISSSRTIQVWRLSRNHPPCRSGRTLCGHCYRAKLLLLELWHTTSALIALCFTAPRQRCVPSNGPDFFTATLKQYLKG